MCALSRPPASRCERLSDATPRRQRSGRRCSTSHWRRPIALRHSPLPASWDDAAQGGGWLGAQGTHVIDQIRTTVGEITRVSATLSTFSPRPMTSDDTYTVQFDTDNGATGVLHSSSAIGGQFLVATKF